ncbi:DUF4411 family protein [Aeoliella sp. SH292]|uniref:DUF4411 family protein n=1 Tax=Aeoliella sp. SH292 TaxID=3454464 RepID=UPI003F9E812A
MTSPITYLLDADTFISAKRQHYGFDFCPGFWDALLRHHLTDRLRSIEPVHRELKRGKDDLTRWTTGTAPKGFFAPITDKRVQAAYAEVIRSVQGNSQYKEAAKQKFASGADPWLVAYANVFGCVIATYEVASPESKSKIKLPDVASTFEVPCTPPFEMLRAVGVILALNP